MKGYTKLNFLRIFGAPVHLHWSALVVIGGLLAVSFKEPLSAVITICSYFGIILLHEAGHAFFAYRLGCRPLNIYLSFIHGQCVYEAPHCSRNEFVIAWGGVLAQFAVAIPLIALAQFTTIASSQSLMGPVVGFLGYFSIMVAILNLVPARGLDGAIAWRLIPVLLKERATQKAKVKTKPSYIRRVK
jgi:Zn-dependent protease